MKIFQKTAAILLGAVMIGSSLCGCTQATVFGSYPKDYSWSYKDSISTMSMGEYIYYNYNSFYQASDKVENNSGNFLSQKVKDDDGVEMTAEQFIKNSTDSSCRNYLYVNKKFNDMKLSLTQDEITNYKANADSQWSSYKNVFEAYGVSKDSFVHAAYENAAKYEAIFKKLYQKGGEKEVSMDELKKYYEDNYVNYSYISVALYDTETNSETSETSTKKKSDDEVKKIKANMDKYAKAINDGTSYEDEIKVYMEDYKVESDPTVSATEILENSSLGDDLKKAIEELKEGEAKYIVVGESGDTPSAYLIYKGKIKDESSKLESDSSLEYSTLINMKSEEFRKYMDTEAAKHKCEINTEGIEKYPAEMFIVEEQPTEDSTEG